MILSSLPAGASSALASACRTADLATSPSVPTLELPALWQMIVVQLDRTQFEFTPAEIAKLFRICACDVRSLCRQLWPGRGGQGQWSLEFDQAAVLIYRLARGSRKLDAPALLRDLQRCGFTGEGVKAHRNVTDAHRAILVDRDRRAGRGK